jgi:hypothetical protein
LVACVSAAWLCLLGAIVIAIGGRAGALVRWAIATGFLRGAMAWFLLVAADGPSIRVQDSWGALVALMIASLGSAPPPRRCERTVPPCRRAASAPDGP